MKLQSRIVYFALSIVFLIGIKTISAQTPFIQTFSPASAPVDATLTLQGTNFGTNAAAVSVWLGPVRAPIQQISNTQLTVRVPLGAHLSQPILWKDSLMAMASRQFSPSFSGGNTALASVDFAAPAQQTPGLNPFVFDFDLDGKPDYSAVKGANQLAFYQNISTPGNLQFVSTYTLTTNYRVIDQTAADFNGDQKPDLAIIVQSNVSSYISIYPNTGTPGNISFGTPVYYNLGSDYPYSLGSADIDGNGKCDLIVGYSSSGNAFSVLRQTGTNGNIAFAAKTNISFGTGGVGTNNKVVVSDLDGDNKPDVSVLGSYYRPIFCYRNTSSSGSVSFAAKLSVETGRPNVITQSPYDLRLVDMDGDLKLDLVLMHGDADSVSIFRNTSTLGSFSFATRLVKQVPSVWGPMTVGDINGDAKPDILYVNTYNSMYVLRNTSTIGSIQIDTAQRYTAIYPMNTIDVQDFDLDQKPDVMISGTDFGGQNNHQLAILRNRVNSPVLESVIPITADSGTTITITGKRFSDVQQLNFGITNARFFQVVNDSTITAVVGAGSSGNVTAITPNGRDVFPGFTYSLPIPAIDSFAPGSGPIGTLVRIYGRKFSTADDVQVRVGSVLAKVVSSDWNHIDFEVPVGINTLPILVNILSRKLQAETTSPFYVTFPGADSFLLANDFGDTVQWDLPSYGTKVLTNDLDLDGRSDFLSPIYFNANKFIAFRNQTDSMPLMVGPRQDWFTYSGSFGGGSSNLVSMVNTDVDGDGKSDVVSVSAYPDSLSVFINNSTTGAIALNRKKDFITGSDPVDVVAGDMDLDGKPDFACSNATAGTISIYKNITDSSGVKLLSKIDSVSSVGSQSLILQDFNGDRLPDLIITNYNNNRITIYKNNSTCGRISFAARKFISTGTGPWYLATADLDRDGKMDLVVVNVGAKSLSIFRNESSSEEILFSTRVDSAIGASLYGLALGDIDGDGFPEMLASSNAFPASLTIYKNESVPGNIQWGRRLNLSKFSSPQMLHLADINQDGKPDILTETDNRKLAVLPNRMGEPALGWMCRPSDTLTLFCELSGSVYQWEIDSGNGFQNLLETAQWIGVQTNRLRLRNIPSSRTGDRYRCRVNGRYSREQQIGFQRRWVGTVSTAWENPANWSCGQVPDAFTDVIIPAGQVVVSSMVNIRSLEVRPGAKVSVRPGFQLITAKP